MADSHFKRYLNLLQIWESWRDFWFFNSRSAGIVSTRHFGIDFHSDSLFQAKSPRESRLQAKTHQSPRLCIVHLLLSYSRLDPFVSTTININNEGFRRPLLFLGCCHRLCSYAYRPSKHGAQEVVLGYRKFFWKNNLGHPRDLLVTCVTLTGLQSSLTPPSAPLFPSSL